MKKVLILTNSINGLYAFRRELIQELNLQGFEIIISAPKNERTSYFTQINCIYMETSISRRSKNPLKDFILLLQYLKILKKVRPIVVLTYTIKPTVYGGLACRIMGVPYIANITGLGSALGRDGFLQKVTLFLYRLSLKKGNCIFFQNKDNQQFFKKNNIVVDNECLIPGSGVNLEHFYLMEYPYNEKIEFLYIGRIMKEKGIEEYLRAARFIKNKYPNTFFHIVGTFEEKLYAQELNKMEEEGIVKYHGRQNDVREFQKFSHCAIHPTYHEGMSNVLLESAACGKPIITTNIPGCKEIVDEGENGFLVKPKDTKDLIEKVEKFINLTFKEKKQMGLAGRKKVEREFDRKNVTNAYVKEIRKCLETK